MKNRSLGKEESVSIKRIYFSITLFMAFLALELFYLQILSAQFRLADGHPPVTFPFFINLMTLLPFFCIPVCMLLVPVAALLEKRLPAIHKITHPLFCFLMLLFCADAIFLTIFFMQP